MTGPTETIGLSSIDNYNETGESAIGFTLIAKLHPKVFHVRAYSIDKDTPPVTSPSS